MDNGGSSPEQRTLTLVVKAPNQAHPDHSVEGVDVSWTVKDLKTHLSRVYPNNPPEKDQRLIYSGKLLPDHLRLLEVFRKSDPTPTVHLVCAIRTPPTAAQRAQAEVTRAEQPSAGRNEGTTAPPSVTPTAPPSVTPTAPPSVTPTMSPSEPPADGLRHRGHPADPWTSHAMPAGAAQMTQPTFPTYSLYSPQQLLWLQQMYARQYYMHYQAAMAAAASAPVTPAATPHPAPLPNQAPIDNLPANQNAPDPRFINPGGANQNMRMNAQGGPVMEDEEDMERDWLDWVYTAARFAVFLSIVYFYSSVSRFVLVMSSLLLMYLHTAGWFPFRRRPMAPGPNEPAPEIIQNQQNQNRNPVQGEVPAAEGNVEGEEGGQGVAATLPAVLVPPLRPSLAWTAWVFFKAFFASLIPEVPQGVAN
ncbi:homocysteine-responsive endoplasmic reticulum-resident ubiquitin-like domain member 1 protein [Megalops cyprinoides]|uniref:homocysteine-responsive endoplasmic reticulum-resident ubiquitin-like domain member 1 protein n=1 Tax=Megalops cyprinoides TaxID=118141 RepID=UPI0018646274|nr:homocysteine-responsive endoplasmic reticulum-resident ubiquitin-like domain member 1 protein [Megalops cyprinoides]